MTDLNPLRQFLSSWFVDTEGPGSDEEAARRFTNSATVEDAQAVLDHAAALMSGDDETLVTTLDIEANRYFESPAEARVWLSAVCDAIRLRTQ